MKWLRFIVLAIAIVGYTIVIAEVGLFAMLALGGVRSINEWPHLIADTFTEPETILILWLPAAVAVATQIIFLLPVFSRRLMLTPHGRPLLLSVCMAAIVAGLLFLGLITAGGELIYLLRTGRTDVGDVIWDSWLDQVIDHSTWGWWPYVLASWIVWMPLMWVFCRRVPSNRLHNRLVGWLLAGTVIEVLVVLPLDIMVRRKSQCYCNTGTFFALTMSVFALLWLAGPGIVLALTSKRRRMWFENVCPNCGYEKGPSPGDRCPECGQVWRGSARAKPQAADC